MSADVNSRGKVKLILTARIASPQAWRKHDMLEPVPPIKPAFVEKVPLELLVLAVRPADVQAELYLSWPIPPRHVLLYLFLQRVLFGIELGGLGLEPTDGLV